MTDFAAVFVERVRDIAKRFPDVRYLPNRGTFGDCNYYPDRLNPHGCIVGLAARELHAEGVIPRDFDRVGTLNASQAVAALYPLSDTDRSEPTWRALYWLDDVQGYQDQGFLWAEAVAKADSVV